MLKLNVSNGSFINYIDALNDLSEGKYEYAMIKLDTAISQEASALKPYILYTIALKDRRDYRLAVKIAEDGLHNADSSSFDLLYSAGDASFSDKNYMQAAQYFERAYDNIDSPSIVADTAMMVAVSYYRGGQKEEANTWYNKAITKLGNDENSKADYSNRWRGVIAKG
jgi:tetratricopeptide (TPR) repeat protein